MSDNGESSETAQAEQSTFSTGGGSGGGGGAGGGRGGGVGHSTGNFDNRTLWHFNGDGTVDITCFSSRLVHCSMPLEEFYRTVPVDTGNSGVGSVTLNGYGYQDITHVQVTTPWKLVDANAWGVWFSPADFQHLVNTCETLDVVSLDQEIFNVVLKTVTETGPQDAKVKVYNNDLTAALLIAQDSNNALPYTPAAIRCETLGFYPWLPTAPSNYRYYSQWVRGLRPSNTGNAGRSTDRPSKPKDQRPRPYPQVNFSLEPGETQSAQLSFTADETDAVDTPPQTRAVEAWFAQQLNYPQFFTIENSLPITMVRTGDSWSSGSYSFSCRTMRLTRNWQTMRAMGMPPQIIPPTSENQTGQLAHPTGAKRLGIGWGNDVHVSEATIMRPTTTGYQAPEWMFINTQAGPAVANGPIGSRSNRAPNWDNGVYSIKYDREHGGNLPADGATPTSYRLQSYERGGTTYKWNNWIQKQLNNNASVPPADFLGTESGQNSGLGTWMPYLGNTYSPYTSYPDPGHHYPWGQIWDKRPDYEHKAEFQPTAPFLTDNPPGQILIKIAPNLTDNYNPNGATFSRIITYCDFWWKGTLKFKAKLRAPHQYNVMNYWVAPNSTEALHRFYPNRMGEMEIPHITTKIMPKVAY